MNRNILFLFALLVASCSELPDNEMSSLPPGKYPISFTASVYDLSVSRTTGKDAWQNNDPIAVSVDGGNSSQIYKITDTATGAMEPETPGDPYYWQQNTGQRILAWYPSTDVTDVDISNQSGGFADFDYLTADLTADFTASAVELPFRHQMAKVKCILTAGDGITSSDISSATIQIYGYTKAAFAKGILSGNTNGWITPTGTDKETLVVPQQMQGKKFIKVTVGTSSAARDYFYTPTGSTDANLEGGKEYTYTVTVEKTGLAVQVTDNGAAWGSGTDITGSTPSTIENHVITITNKSSLNNLEVKDADGTAISAQHDGTYQLPATATTFSVSYDAPSDKKQSLVPTSGLCRLSSRNGDNTGGSLKYICNYSGVISNVTLTLEEYVKMGDFYYSDGTWSAPFTVSADAAANSTSPTIIGIVLKVGKDESGDWKDDCQYKKKGTTTAMSTINGYVLALYDANSGGYCPWESSNTKVEHADMNRDQNTGFYGYKNTQAIISFNTGTLSSAFPATYYATVGYEASYPAPANSSGWFLPSAGQCKYWVNNQVTLLESVKKATGDSGYKWKDWYWSSSEYSNNPADYAWCAYFIGSRVSNGYKSYSYYVRSCLAF